jgi:hypothetical protein
LIEFMVLSAPRSASTWVANWLTTRRTLCLHDPILEHSPEDMDAIVCDRTLGLACTGLALLPDFVNAHPAPKVVVHRDLDEVNASLTAIGLSRLAPVWRRALGRIDGLHVCYADLFDPVAAARIHDHLMGGQDFDAARHRELCAMRIEPNFEKIAVVPERARDFRQRIERALA